MTQRLLSGILGTPPSPSKSKLDRDKRKADSGNPRRDAIEADDAIAEDEILFNGDTIMASPENLRLKNLQDQLRDAVRTNDKEYAEELRQEIKEIKDHEDADAMTKKLDTKQKSEEKKVTAADFCVNTDVGNRLMVPDEIPVKEDGAPNTYSFEAPTEENEIEERDGDTHTSNETNARYLEFRANVNRVLSISANASWHTLVNVAKKMSSNQADLDVNDKEITFPSGHEIDFSDYLILCSENGLNLKTKNGTPMKRGKSDEEIILFTDSGERVKIINSYGDIKEIVLSSATPASRISASKYKRIS